MSYVLMDGTAVNAQQIKNAYADGRAVIIHGRAEWCTTTALMLDGQHYDTRGECYSMRDEAWTRSPQTLRAALDAAYYNPKRAR